MVLVRNVVNLEKVKIIKISRQTEKEVLWC